MYGGETRAHPDFGGPRAPRPDERADETGSNLGDYDYSQPGGCIRAFRHKLAAPATASIRAMASLLLLLVLASPAAPGEMYRCVDAAGKAYYQDHTCGAERGTRLKPGADGRIDTGELRHWLTQFQRDPRAAAGSLPGSAPAAGSSRASAPAAPAISISEGVLAACSAKLLDCAADSSAATDACVAAVPTCVGARSSDCCPQVSLACYRGLRQSGAPLAGAMHAALIDPVGCVAR